MDNNLSRREECIEQMKSSVLKAIAQDCLALVPMFPFRNDLEKYINDHVEKTLDYIYDGKGEMDSE